MCWECSGTGWRQCLWWWLWRGGGSSFWGPFPISLSAVEVQFCSWLAVFLGQAAFLTDYMTFGYNWKNPILGLFLFDLGWANKAMFYNIYVYQMGCCCCNSMCVQSFQHPVLPASWPSLKSPAPPSTCPGESQLQQMESCRVIESSTSLWLLSRVRKTSDHTYSWEMTQ